LRYLVTGPGGAVVLDQSSSQNMANGETPGSVTLTLPASAEHGAYTFQATLTYQDNDNATKTSSRSTSFTISNSPPPLTSNLQMVRVHIADVNHIARLAFNTGEPLFFKGTVYSTFPAPESGTIQHQLAAGLLQIVNQTVPVTYNPGVTSGAISIVPTGGNATSPTTVTYSVTAATSSGQTSTASTSLVFSPPDAPSLNFGATALEPMK
jgi:hypothetical protein